MDKYFSGWARECGVSMDDLMALGHRVGDSKDDPFNMAVMGLRLAGRSNAVAKLHGEVSREMFSDLWPDVPDDEVPIGSVTNGVHSGTWVRAGDLRPARQVRAPVVGRRRPASAGRGSSTPPTTSCGGRRSRAASGSWRSSGSA